MIQMNIEDCYKKERIIIKEIEAQFPNARKQPTRKLIHKSDSTGKSVYNFTSFIFNDGTINIECTNWSNDITSKRGWGDGLAVMINTNEENIKLNRLSLLDSINNFYTNVANISILSH